MRILYWLAQIAQNPPPDSGAAPAQTAPVVSTAPPGPDPVMTMTWIMLLFVVMYFLVIRPPAKQRKELERKVKALKKGDRILFSGGILGEVINPEGRDNLVVVRIADDVKIEIQRSAINAVLGQ